ncbi:MAG: TIGR02996 domain-containing protein [Gemmataceae bacterium]|nr:TIGR02996 domain-containing protein [Gemmataceae bacterium]
MTDRDALLAAVLAAPDDDLPRLVFADWLDEHGDPDRAAFIRYQVEAARAEPYSPAWRAATAAAQLHARHQDNWARHLLPTGLLGDFARGFVERVRGVDNEFLRAAEAVFAADPVRVVTLLRIVRPGVPPVEAIFDLPQLRSLTGLGVRGDGLSGLEYHALTDSPHLAGLTDLSLAGNPVDPPWLAEFLAGDRLPELVGLDLSDNPHLGPAVADGLGEAGHRRLARLDLSGVVMRSGELQQVLEARCLAGVEELRLRSADPKARWPAAHLDLGWVVPWGRLRVLDLAGQGVGAEGCREIARTAEARSLRWLGLAGNDLGPEAVRLLVESPHLNLYHLDVRGNGLGPRSLDLLGGRFPDAEVLG